MILYLQLLTLRKLLEVDVHKTLIGYLTFCMTLELKAGH